MSGHSKWATIKRRKESVDSKKGKVFGMISKLITVAVREGGSGDPTQNPRLRMMLDKAKEANMPKVNVQKAIDKGLGKGDGGIIDEILYEGFGPGGVGVLVKVLTDNKNRSASEIKTLFDRGGGSLGGPGAVSYLFERQHDGYAVKVWIPVDNETADKVEILLENLEENEDVEYVVSNMQRS